MAVYNVQKFSYDGGDSVCFGQQDEHNHDKAVQFTHDVTNYLVSQGCVKVVAGIFQSKQPRPKAGKEFRWNGNNWIRI
ncbi:hypothetical protein ORI89_06620 [Sphingobacterium sp. UT-1RO-CII-1]|uniref:hypothetical protein n=1 Tax=Sphingobacterium sp. UT-1RO-CII-1 TaxID=2995225 RepID=UPI002279F5F8|nr:hypothetical protein [Sphingobacterium sp. UT-1RO-CII-1]MCY4779316.1 hypothetical protein [Sphingobacterium sp. UT-1RO-CII-1]